MMNKMIMIGSREANLVDNDYIAKRFNRLVGKLSSERILF